MNNAKFAIDSFKLEPEVDRTPLYKEREATLMRQIDALRRVAESQDWCSLKKELWDGVVETLEKQLKSEAEKDKPDTMVLAKINGQLVWARKWSDLKKIADILMVELTNVRKKLNK